MQGLSGERRLQVLEWLRRPIAHFPPQRDGDLETDGVCVVLLAEKLGVSQPTATVHLKILAEAGLLTATRRRQWTFYRRDEAAIERIREELAGAL